MYAEFATFGRMYLSKFHIIYIQTNTKTKGCLYLVRFPSSDRVEMVTHFPVCLFCCLINTKCRCVYIIQKQKYENLKLMEKYFIAFQSSQQKCFRLSKHGTPSMPWLESRILKSMNPENNARTEVFGFWAHRAMGRCQSLVCLLRASSSN